MVDLSVSFQVCLSLVYSGSRGNVSYIEAGLQHSHSVVCTPLPCSSLVPSGHVFVAVRCFSFRHSSLTEFPFQPACHDVLRIPNDKSCRSMNVEFEEDEANLLDNLVIHFKQLSLMTKQRPTSVAFRNDLPVNRTSECSANTDLRRQSMDSKTAAPSEVPRIDSSPHSAANYSRNLNGIQAAVSFYIVRVCAFFLRLILRGSLSEPQRRVHLQGREIVRLSFEFRFS